MARTEITPLDPDSDKGREVAERLSQVLAEVRVAIAERKRFLHGGVTASAGSSAAVKRRSNGTATTPAS